MSNSGGVPGFQIPMGIKVRKNKVDELLQLHEDLDEGIALSYFSSLNEAAGEEVGKKLDDGEYCVVADDMRLHAIRELIRKKVREVVRKKAGGGGYVLYSPNQGKKKNPKPVGNFPTKIAAKRAELARFPPKDPGKLQRLRKEVDKLSKDPKKRADREKSAAKAKGTDDHVKKNAHPKKESVQEAPMFGDTAGVTVHKDLPGFMTGLKALPKDGPQRGKYITAHMSDPNFLGALQKHPQGPQLHKQLMGFLNSPKNAGTGGPMQVRAEAAERSMDFMHRRILAKIIKESLFREERTGSEWDEYISKISSKALSGDKKFQNLQKNIEKRTATTLASSLAAVKKVLPKGSKVKDYGIKHSPEKGKTYLAFGVTLGEVVVEPMYIYINAGVPQIEVSDQAKVALTKTDPEDAKLFRAELVTVQERILDKMDDLASAIDARDNYLTKVEATVDGYVAGLSPLELSLLKQLLVKKYRKLA